MSSGNHSANLSETEKWALALLRNEVTPAEVCAAIGLSEADLVNWRERVLERAYLAFDSEVVKREIAVDEVKQLRRLSRLLAHVNWLRNKLGYSVIHLADIDAWDERSHSE